MAPHPDDEAIGCPATLLKLQRAGCKVHNVIVSLGRPGQHARRRAEALEAARRAGFETTFLDPPVGISDGDDLEAAQAEVQAAVTRLIEELAVSVVVSPSPHDVHHGHEVVGRGVQAALANLEDGPVWWMWGLWGDLPVPTLFVPFDQPELDEVLWILDAYQGENDRNDYRRLVQGRAGANAVLGSERVFGFGSPAASDLAHAELLTEARWRSGRWQAGGPRLLNADALLTPSWQRDLTPWVTAPSARQLLQPVSASN